MNEFLHHVTMKLYYLCIISTYTCYTYVVRTPRGRKDHTLYLSAGSLPLPDGPVKRDQARERGREPASPWRGRALGRSIWTRSSEVRWTLGRRDTCVSSSLLRLRHSKAAQRPAGLPGFPYGVQAVSAGRVPGVLQEERRSGVRVRSEPGASVREV